MIGENSVTAWPVYAVYELAHGRLYARGEIVLRYDPTEHIELVGEFAKLHRGDEAQLVGFARGWGSLGWAVVHPEAGGEPLPWIWNQAELIRNVLRLIHYLQTGDVEGLRIFLSAYRKEPYEIAIGDITWTFDPSAKDDPAGVAWSIIHAVVDILPLRAWPVRRFDVPVCPLAAVYWHVSRAVREGRPVVYCEECGAPFVQTDRRQRFCPRPPRYKGKGSACGAAHRQRRRRRRLKEGG